MLGVLLVILLDEGGDECAKWRAELRVRPGAGVSALPLTSCGVCFRGTCCLRDGGRDGAGDGSFLAVTLDDTRLFLSGLQAVREKSEGFVFSFRFD